MPYVNVKITRDGVTAAQKKKLIEDITSSLVSTLGKQPEHVHIVIDEVDPDNWGYAGMLTSEYRRTKGGSGAPAPAPKKGAQTRRKNA